MQQMKTFAFGTPESESPPPSEHVTPSPEQNSTPDSTSTAPPTEQTRPKAPAKPRQGVVPPTNQYLSPRSSPTSTGSTSTANPATTPVGAPAKNKYTDEEDDSSTPNTSRQLFQSPSSPARGSRRFNITEVTPERVGARDKHGVPVESRSKKRLSTNFANVSLEDAGDQKKAKYGGGAKVSFGPTNAGKPMYTLVRADGKSHTYKYKKSFEKAVAQVNGRKSYSFVDSKGKSHELKSKVAFAKALSEFAD